MKTEELNRHPASESKTCEKKQVERELVFEPEFIEDLKYWIDTDKKTSVRVLSFVEEIKRNPFIGTGKPEPLRYSDGNVWSRRINKKDRLVYRVIEAKIYFIQARYHYDDR
jgi:toxin YoeB